MRTVRNSSHLGGGVPGPGGVPGGGVCGIPAWTEADTLPPSPRGHNDRHV